MSCCGLSSTGLNNIDANEFTSDNATVFSNLYVGGNTILNNATTILSSLNVSGSLYVSGLNVLQTFNNINGYIGTSISGLNITSNSSINFNVGTQLTVINLSGLSVFHDVYETFPYNYAGWYNVGDRLNNLYHVMADSPVNIINFDATHNTVIRIREQDTVNQIYYPRQFQVQTFEGTAISKFDVQGLQVLDKYNNWYYINKLFSLTNNSTLLCGDKIMVDSNGSLNVYFPATSTWLNVADNLFNNSAEATADKINTAVNSIIGAVGALATLANYYQSLQLTLAVTSGVVVGSGLLLAFQLKEDRFDVKFPLVKRAPDNGEVFNQLELKYNETLIKSVDNSLSINTTGFLCPYFGDLSLASTPANITSNSSSYVVVTKLSQPITCHSSLTVSGHTTLINNVTCMSNLNINGAIFCSSINSSTTSELSSNLNSLSSYSSLNISNLQSTSTTIFNNLNNLSSNSSLNISNLQSTSTTIFNNLNNLSSNSSLNISNLQSTSTTIFNNLNNTSTYSSLNISNLQSTSTTILNNLNSLSSCSILNVNSLNVSGISIFNNDITANSNLYAVNIPKKSTFNIIITTASMIGSTVYYRYDLDLRSYTKSLSFPPTTTIRKFKFMCWLASGTHNAGLYSLNYDIDYAFTSNFSNFNGLNALAYGYPYENYRLNKITPNGLFIWKVDFNYLTIFSKEEVNLQCIIIDYL